MIFLGCDGGSTKTEWLLADHTGQVLSHRIFPGCNYAFLGEAGFREHELAVSRALAREQGLVIACGGGLPTRPDAIAALKGSGAVFWLNRDPGVIYDTVSMARRPLGQGGRDAFLERFRQREPIYRRWADYIIEGHSQAAQAAARIADIYERECQG